MSLKRLYVAYRTMLIHAHFVWKQRNKPHWVIMSIIAVQITCDFSNSKSKSFNNLLLKLHKRWLNVQLQFRMIQLSNINYSSPFDWNFSRLSQYDFDARIKLEKVKKVIYRCVCVWLMPSKMFILWLNLCSV